MVPLAELVKRMGVLALLLAAVLFAWPGEAQAHEGHQAEPAVHQHAAHDHEAQDEQAPEEDGGSIHHKGGCHCISAACASVLPSVAPSHVIWQPRARHDRPAALAAQALAGVDPPSKPPRT